MASLVKRGLERARRVIHRTKNGSRASHAKKIQSPGIQRIKPMNAIIHIGEPKSGSTTIQSFLFQNREALARQGFRHSRSVRHVTSQFEPPLEAMRRLGQLPSNESKRRRYKAMTLEQLTESLHQKINSLRAYPSRWAEDTAVFSSEHIVPLIDTPELVREFDAMMAETFAERRYVLYLREPVSRWVSGYSERMKRGQSVSFDQFLDHAAKNKSQSEVAQLWADTLGRNRVDIRLMDKGFLQNGDLIIDFCTICGMDLAGLVQPHRANESLTALGVIVMRALNRRIPMLTEDGKRNPLRKGLLAAVMERTGDSPHFEPSPEQILRLEDMAKPSNGTLHREFFPDRDELFQKRPERGQLDLQSLNQDAFDVLSGIITDLRLGKIASIDKRERNRALAREPGDYFTE